jgi:creatinine amidohydrolase
MSWQLADLNWETFRSRVPSEVDAAILPVGTVEAHGAIPLGTDILIPSALAVDLAPRLPALVAPPVPYGVTNSLLPYPGSTTVSSATFVAYLFEAAAGLADAGFRRIVLLNGHGGQSREVGEVVARLWAEKRAFSVAVEWWGPAREATLELYGDVTSGHAGVEETAMVLAIAPGLVDAARATSIRRVAVREGVKARPFPASVILERPERNGDGAPVLDPAKAAEFRRRVTDRVHAAIRDVFDGWEELRGK